MLKISELYNKSLTVESEDKDWNDEKVEDIKEEIDKVGPTPLDWLEYIIDRENISAPVTKNPKEIISSLNVLMDSIGYVQQSDIHAVEYFIGDNPKVFSMIVNFIKDVIEHEKSNHIDFSQALEVAIKNNYNVEISDNIEEDTENEVKEFNKKRDELETLVSKAEEALEVAKQEEDEALIEVAKQKLRDAWKALNDFDENHFEASNNVNEETEGSGK